MAAAFVSRFSPLLRTLDEQGWYCATCHIEQETLYEIDLDGDGPRALCDTCRPRVADVQRDLNVALHDLSRHRGPAGAPKALVTRVHALKAALSPTALTRPPQPAPPAVSAQPEPGTTRGWCASCGHDADAWFTLSPGAAVSVYCRPCAGFTTFAYGVPLPPRPRGFHRRTTEEQRLARLRAGRIG